MTRLTPTQQAFWLAVFEHAQIISGASEKRAGVAKLWWRMKEIEVPALSAEASAEIVRNYITRTGMLIESRSSLLALLFSCVVCKPHLFLVRGRRALVDKELQEPARGQAADIEQVLGDEQPCE